MEESKRGVSPRPGSFIQRTSTFLGNKIITPIPSNLGDGQTYHASKDFL